MNSMRKPRLYFDEGPDPAGVTFDDGERCRRNLPWIRFASADWDYTDPATIRIEIGEWQVVVGGHNLEPLFAAIARAQLACVRAHPEFADDPEHEADVFVVSIRFIHQSCATPPRGRAAQLRLPV